MELTKGFKCVLCGKQSLGWGKNQQFGNNPFPLSSEGDCCDDCNNKKVIPERIKRMRSENMRNYKNGK